MSERLEVVITGQDGVSKTFVAISRGAEQAGKSVETAGKRGAQGMKELGREAQDSAKRMDQAKAAATAIGAVMGTVTGAVSIAGRAFRDQERQVAGVTALYGDAADEMLSYAETVQASMGYSNDAARESMLLASSLVSNYQLSADQIELLISRSADLAQTFGFTLEDAVQRTSAAIRGEGESAERLGLNLSDAAIAARALDAGITNWNVPGALSEAEKAAFRFQLLMEDTADTVGAAAQRDAGAGGMFRELVFEIQDATQAVGGFLGPIGQVAAEMAPLAMAAPVVGAGIGRISTAARSGSLGMAALGAATNPVVLGLGAVAAAGVVTWSIFNDGREATQSLEDALIRLGDVATNLRLGYRDQEANWVQEMQVDTEYAVALGKTWLEDMDLMWEMAGTKAEEWGISQQDAVYRLQEAYEVTGDHAREFSAAIDTVGAAFTNSAVDHAELDAALDVLDAQLRSREITLDEYADAYIDIANNIDDFRLSEEDAAAATERMDAAMRGVTAVTRVSSDGFAELAVNVRGLGEAAAGSAGRITDVARAAHAEMLAELQAMTSEWIAGMMAVTGQDDPLSQWNLSGNASDAAILADNLTDVGTAADTAFRVIVGNTNAIKSQADATLDWATELINVRGEIGRIDDLLGAGLIDRTQYDAAQVAYDGIADSVLRIGDNLDTVQAIQAPLMADLIESQAAYTDELRQMPAAQQLVALAWMDSATAAKAMEISTMAAAVAAGELGAQGEDAFLAMITGAAQADPVLKALLIDMGLISEGADGTITVNLEGAEAAQSDLDRLNTTIVDLIDLLDDGVLNGSYTIKVATEVEPPVVPPPAGGDGGGYTGAYWTPPWKIKPEVEPPEIPVDFWTPEPVEVPTTADTGGAAESLNAFEPEPITLPVTLSYNNPVQAFDEDPDGRGAVGGMQDVTITITADDQASPVIQAVQDAVDALDGAVANVTITAENSDAVTDMNAIIFAYNDLSGAVANVTVTGDNASAMAAIGDTGHNLAVLDGAAATVFVAGDNSGAMAAISEAAAYNGTVVATTYLDVVTRYSSIGSPSKAHGGVVDGYASGGVVIEAAEVGYEIAHFPMGGTALLPNHGLYDVPLGTYISPHNAAPGGLGGMTVNFNVQGNIVGSNRAELNEWADQELVPRFERAVEQRRRALGVM